jgi:hypothetical protein
MAAFRFEVEDPLSREAPPSNRTVTRVRGRPAGCLIIRTT